MQFNLVQFSSIHSIQFNSVQFNTIHFNSIKFNSIQFNSVQPLYPKRKLHSQVTAFKKIVVSQTRQQCISSLIPESKKPQIT
jgi:hypothetical protein